MTQTAFLNSAHVPVATRVGTRAGERFLVLDSWRGICALLVALFHFPTSSIISQSAFVGGSYLFVDFFFVLSGFVIASSYDGRRSCHACRLRCRNCMAPVPRPPPAASTSKAS